MCAQAAIKPLTLRYLKTVGIINNISGRGFNNPYDLAVSRDGRIFVANRCGSEERARAVRVGICTLDEEYLHEFGTYGASDGQMTLPTSIAFDSSDRLHLTDEHLHRVSVFDSSGIYLSRWGEHGSGEGHLDGPSGIAFDSKDNAYVVDQNNHRVQRFTNDGEYVLQWGWHGDGDGRFNLPWGVAVDSDDNVYVADWRNDRIQKFTADGRFIAKFGESGDGDGQFSRPAGVAVDDEGYIYVADWGNERVQVLGPDGGFILKLRGQATESKWGMEYLTSSPEELEARKSAELFPVPPARLSSRYHVSSQTEPYFWGPVSVTLDSEGRLYVTEGNRHRFQVYQKA